MKLLYVLVALVPLLSAASGSAGSSDEKHQNQTSHHKAATKNQAVHATRPPTIIVEPAPAKIIQNAPSAREQTTKQKWYQRPSVTDWGVLVVTFVYAAISLGLLKATRRQATIMRDQLERAQRAFVFLKQINPVPITDRDTLNIVAYRFETLWENSGVTPTRGLLCHTNAWSQSTRLPKGFWFLPLGDLTPIPLVLGPRAEVGGMPLDIGVDTLMAVQNNSQFIYFYGWVTYRDVFKGTPEHVTKFCWTIAQIFGDLSNPNNPQFPIRFVFKMHSEHNCADEECSQQS